MANIRKSFNFRNGVQVDDDNFIVNPNGLVGIGTSIPTEFLDVHGTAKITGLVTATNLAVTGVSTFYSDVKIGSGITFTSSGEVRAGTFFGSAAGLTGIFAISTSGWYINAGNISTTSKVGIGTTLPSSQLDVVGDVKVSGIVTASGFGGYQVLVGTESSAIKTFSVRVASKTSNHRYFGTGSANAYLIDGKESPFLTLLPGKTYYFDQSDPSNIDNPLRFYLEVDRTTPYNTNVTTSAEVPGTSNSYTQIEVKDTTPVVLHYQSLSSAYMGNAVQFNSNIVNTPYQITTLAGISATTGVVTAYSFSGFGTNIQGINATNITNGTLNNSRLPQSISITGIITASSGIITSLTSTNLNNTGIATLGITSISNLNVGGGVTINSNLNVGGGVTITSAGIFAPTGIITASTFVGGLVGIASTARDLTYEAKLNITRIESVTSSIAISTVSTRLYAESIGVGTNSPSGDIHIRRNGQSRLQVTSDTAEAIIAVGRSATFNQNNGALIFGNTSGIYPYSDSKTLDIVNYDTGNLNYYLNYGLAGVGTGNFNWFHSLNGNNPLMSLTYSGNLGIGITNPSEKLHVSGIASVSSLITGNITATGSINVTTGSINATGAGTSTSVRTLYVYGGKSEILNANGTEIFPTNTNLNITSGVSTFYDINATANITATGAGTSISARELYVYGGRSKLLNANGTEIFPILTENENLNIISGVSTFYDINATGKITATGNIAAYGINASGIITATGSINSAANITATGAGTSTSVRTLYVYGGKSEILNANGTPIFPILTEDKNLNITSGISTFYEINAVNDIHGNHGYFNRIGIDTTTIGYSIIIQDGAIGIGTDNVPPGLRLSCLGTPEDPFGSLFGYVGIGTTTVENADTYLKVVGNSEFYGGVGIGTTNTGTANLAIVNSSSTASLSIGQNVDGTGSNHLGFWYGFGGSKANIFTSNGNMRFDVDGAGGSASSFQFGRGFGTTYAVIGNTGNLGIGTTTPTSKLTVVGDARITGVTTSQNGFTSGIGVTDPVQITVSGNTLTFNVVGVGSTSLTLY